MDEEQRFLREVFGQDPTDEQLREYLLRLAQEALEEEMRRKARAAKVKNSKRA